MIKPWQDQLLRQLFEPDEIDAALQQDPDVLTKLWGAVGDDLRLHEQDRLRGSDRAPACTSQEFCSPAMTQPWAHDSRCPLSCGRSSR